MAVASALNFAPLFRQGVLMAHTSFVPTILGDKASHHFTLLHHVTCALWRWTGYGYRRFLALTELRRNRRPEFVSNGLRPPQQCVDLLSDTIVFPPHNRPSPLRRTSRHSGLRHCSKRRRTSILDWMISLPRCPCFALNRVSQGLFPLDSLHGRSPSVTSVPMRLRRLRRSAWNPQSQCDH